MRAFLNKSLPYSRYSIVKMNPLFMISAKKFSNPLKDKETAEEKFFFDKEESNK
jgi:hypothetical protein